MKVTRVRGTGRLNAAAVRRGADGPATGARCQGCSPNQRRIGHSGRMIPPTMPRADGSLRPSWDWDDPAVRTYPWLRAKLVLGFVLGVLFVGVFSYFFVGDEAESTFQSVSPGVAGYVLVYPFVIALVLGNIKRLSPPSTEFANREDTARTQEGDDDKRRSGRGFFSAGFSGRKPS